MNDELQYLLRRADQEAIRMIAALHPAAAAAHGTMCRVYSGAAQMQMRGPVPRRSR